jgi:hypothetical protein
MAVNHMPRTCQAKSLNQLPLTSFETFDDLVDDIQTTAAANDTVIAVARSQRFDGIFDLHGLPDDAKRAGKASPSDFTLKRISLI